MASTAAGGKPPSNTAVSSKSPVARKQEVYSVSRRKEGNLREELKILGLNRVMTQVKQSCGLLHQSTRLRQLYQRVQF